MKSAVFDQPVILERPPIWSSVFIWLIMGMTASGVGWAAWAQIDQSIAATGKLEPQGAVVEVKAPTNGVVRDIHVKGGQLVKKGQLLVTLDATNPEADVESLKQQRDALMRENQFFTAALSGNTVGEAGSELENLTKLRANLISETQFLQAQLNGAAVASNGGEFDRNQEQLLIASRNESQSREQAVSLRVDELEQQLNQVNKQIPTAQGQIAISQGQLETARRQLETAQRQLPNVIAQLENARRQYVASQQRLENAKQDLPKARERLENARRQLPRALEQLETARRQIPTAQAQLETAKQGLAVNQSIMGRIQPVVAEGALSELQEERQEQEILRSQAEVSNREAELLSRQQQLAAQEAQILTQQNEISSREAEVLRSEDEIAAREEELLRFQNEIGARESEILGAENEIAAREGEILRLQNELLSRSGEVDRLLSEQERLEVAMSRSRQEVQNTRAISQRDVLARIAENQKRISDINGQLSRLKLENDKRISQIDGQLAKANLELQYQELKAPVDGYVFDLKPNSPGYVTLAQSPEPLLKIVPNNELEASVYIQNQDIAMVLDALRKSQEDGQPGVPVEISIEAFPATEYGTVRGVLTSIGSDVLPPDETRRFYAFPATIILDSEKFLLDNGLQVSLQSGMAVQGNIKIGKRSVLQIFLSRMTNKTRSIETVK
ncbi:HlyD family efflux transporter periplasmic adaptor subunit [Laspinema olomoucense]|uniref:HlyD family efflux transporter periplasmic adaptor subunit n=1 Tax=Laspinema olomoucense TaxID=3231600 RepID=UPI0021BA997D|nr:HlyD family efflux transporter periplasmic adaptor subunit [Laspinema sp. D3a]MCT7987716.1 HlyD family efflux transporter periplasmic adaptor subunit [Laspinema sp. D3a]